MPLIVIGGQASKIGKTSVAVAIISRFRNFPWIAAKTTPHLHQRPDCDLLESGSDWRLWKQASASGANDTARFLAAGAKTALLLEAEDKAMPMAAAALQRRLDGCSHVIIESNRIVDFVHPDLFLLLLSASQNEFKLKLSLDARIRQADILLLQGERWRLPHDIQAAIDQKVTLEFSVPIRDDEPWLDAIAEQIVGKS
jgi:hypothetical protein